MAEESLTYQRIDQDVLKTLERPGKKYFILLGGVLAVFLVGLAAFINQVRMGLGMAGYTHPVMWAVYITDFVFWVGIAHCGTLISAILFLFRARFRRAVYRTSEAMTVFAVMTAGLFPLIHLGRIWNFYWLFPYPNQRQLWVNFKSPLIWDVFAVSTYFTVSATFFIVGLIPDIAVARDHAKNRFRKTLYTILSLGWRGTDQEWRHYYKAYLFFAALATPLVLSVHSVVSWDFAVSIVPGWHTTIFAPYFVAGAIFSGVGMVITLLIPLRKAFHLEKYITVEYHLDRLAKLVLLTSGIVTYAYGCEFFLSWYSGNPIEKEAFFNRAFGDFWWATWIMITCNCFIPPLLFIKKVRHNIKALFIISIFVNIGMWFERFVIIVISLSHEYIPYAWGSYKISPTEIAITAGSFAWFFLWFLLFVKLLPSVSMTEMKELVKPPKRMGQS
ncbi:MAG: polysulfide reductase NrfD [Deltaproteobacteria bacterium]|nr:polysulfide reductase NrfD [Deltaproteobacteria bacterium]